MEKLGLSLGTLMFNFTRRLWWHCGILCGPYKEWHESRVIFYNRTNVGKRL